MKVKMTPLEEIAEIRTGIAVYGEPKVRSGVETVPMLSVRSLGETEIDRNQTQLVEASYRDKFSFSLKEGDVLLPARSTAIKTAITPREFEGFVIHSTLVAIRCLPALDPRLLVAYFNHPQGMAALDEISQSGTRQKNITVRALARLLVPVPPKQDQAQLAELLEAANNAYNNAVQAAQKRLDLAREIVVNRMFGREK